MCGIAGMIGSWGAKEAEASLLAMLRAESHRGPDDEGMRVIESGSGRVALGNRRLAIQDLSPLGHQPMVDEATGVTVAYNGEIYNAPELRQTLEKGGARFRGHSDTEVILQGYLAWGTDVLPRLVGMYALAIFDPRSSKVLLARDHLGIKPLYVARTREGLIFASEIRALLASGHVPREVDPRGLAGFLAYGAVPEPLTILKDVHAFPPGEWVEFDTDGTRVAEGRHWSFPVPRADVDGDALVSEGRTLLARAVHQHLLSDVPVGVFLSSGLDSTAVAAFARGRADVTAFTVTLPSHENLDEGRAAASTAARLGIPHAQCPVGEDEARGWMLRAIDAMDQPALDGVNVHIISARVRSEGIVVALSGQGGDEVLGGYRSFEEVPRWSRRLARVPRPARVLAARLATWGRDSTAREKAEDIARAGPDVVGLVHQFRRLHSDAEMGAFGIVPQAVGLTSSYHLPDHDGSRLVIPDDPVATIARIELGFYLRDTLLREGDVQGMANSLEIRVPFLDREFVEWALQIPGATLRPARGPSKPLLRAIAADHYASDQVAAAKRGFTLPFADWMRGPLAPIVEEALGDLARSGLVEPAGIERVRAKFDREPDSNAWSRLFALVALGRWLRRNGIVEATS